MTQNLKNNLIIKHLATPLLFIFWLKHNYVRVINTIHTMGSRSFDYAKVVNLLKHNSNVKEHIVKPIFH